MSVLHLFDFYLPNTMNWAYHLIGNLQDTQSIVSAPWIVKNKYYDEKEMTYVWPVFQSITGIKPVSEFQFRQLADFLIRVENFIPLHEKFLYHNFKGSPPDIIHANFGPVGYHYLPLAQKLDVPLIVSFHGYDIAKLPFIKPVFKRRYQKLFEYSSAVICMGAKDIPLLSKLRCPENKLHVIPLGIPIVSPKNIMVNKIPGRLKLIQVGTITRKKGYMDTLRALNIALQRCPNTSLTIIGEPYDQSLVKEMKAFIAKHDLEKVTTWTDGIEHDKLTKILSMHDVLIQPSCQTADKDLEGGPLIVLEAQAMGLPVIATSHQNIPFRVIHEKTGLLTPENDPVSLAGSIERFYWMAEEEYCAFSSSAIDFVTANFDVKHLSMKLCALYGQIVASNA